MVKLEPIHCLYASRWPKMRQHGPKRVPTLGQDGLKMPNMRQHGLTYAPILKKHHFPAVFPDFGSPEIVKDRAKVGPRWPSWSRDDTRERPDRAKMAKLEPRWCQHGSKMAKDEPTWADIGTQYGLRLRITAPVHQISPSAGGASGFFRKMSGWPLGKVYISKE